MRFGFDGLAAQVAHVLDADPFICVGRDYVAASPGNPSPCGYGQAWPPHNLEALQQLQHRVFRLEPGGLLTGDAGLVEAAAHHLDVGCGVAMCGCHLRMPKPRLDGQEIHPGLQQRHRERMSQDMRRHGFSCQFWPAHGGASNGSPHDVRCPETRQALAMRADEERTFLVGFEVTFAHQCLQRFDEIVWKRHDPLFAAFAAQQHLRSHAIKSKIACVDPERFGNARAGSPEKKEQCPIPAATTCSLVRRVDEGVKLLSGEVVCHLGV